MQHRGVRSYAMPVTYSAYTQWPFTHKGWPNKIETACQSGATQPIFSTPARGVKREYSWACQQSTGTQSRRTVTDHAGKSNAGEKGAPGCCLSTSHTCCILSYIVEQDHMRAATMDLDWDKHKLYSSRKVPHSLATARFVRIRMASWMAGGS